MRETETETEAETQRITVSKLLQSFLRHIRNKNLQFKNDFKIAELLTKIFFFLHF